VVKVGWHRRDYIAIYSQRRRRVTTVAQEAWESIEVEMERRRRGTSSENVSGIVFDAMFLEKCKVFILEGHVAMARLLIQNIPFDRGQI
jgi:hypothetical protein